mgnify:CR=1 FL=1
MKSKQKSETVLILHNLRSRENVGSIFRTGDAAGVSKIYLVGTTPRPTDRFGRRDNKLLKASLGAEQFVAWEYAKSIASVLRKVRKERFQVVAVEQAPRAVSLYAFKRRARTCFIFGNEVNGIPSSILRVADKVLEIPMSGKKESLNVAGTVGIVLFNK